MLKKRIPAIIITPFLGAFLGYLLVITLNNGWFSSKWQEIEKPPGEALRLVALNQDSVWVESAAGTIYYNENSSTCESDCWREVSEVPAQPVVRTDEATVSSEACAPSPPLFRVKGKISECWRTMWVDYNFTFALRRDGSIYLWKADLYREWTVVLLFGGICIGAIALFVPTLMYVLFLGIRDQRSKKRAII